MRHSKITQITGIVLLIGFFGLLSESVWGQSTESKVRDKAYERHLNKEREPVPYPFLREADVFWEKRIWRMIYVKEKMNLHFSFPNFEGIEDKPKPLITVIQGAAKNGDITVFNPINDEFTKPMTPEEVKQIGYSKDTTWVTDPTTGKEQRKVIEKELQLSNIKSYRIKEDWIFDSKLSTMYVRIMGIAPFRAKYDENGNFVADVPMYWVYYPDLRPVLADAESFNMYNDAARLTWLDVFEMRLFDSKIMKESNVYDRRIEDYAAGKDALYEAQNIKNEMFNFEQDLWSY